MKILHIVTGLQKASGITTFVDNVVAELRKLDYDVDVLTKATSLDKAYDKHVCSNYDVVHIHGLWNPWLHKMSKHAKRVVWSPHGMLQIWALKNKWLKKLVALMLYQWWDLRKADVIHVTAQSEVEDVRRLRLKNKIVIAPLGVNVPEGKGDVCKIEGQKRTLLFVSRIQRKKGLPNLLNAWSRVDIDKKRGWQIRIVGPDEDGHIMELKRQAKALHIDDEITFVGPLYDEQLAKEYDAADLFVLPTHSENFGSVIIEALAHKLPVICTKGAPWEDLELYRCGWWIDDDVNALTNAINQILDLSASELKEIGNRGRKLVEEKYTWASVARRLEIAYASDII